MLNLEEFTGWEKSGHINKKGEVPRKEWSDPLASIEEGFGE